MAAVGAAAAAALLAPSAAAATDDDLVAYTGPVEHIFFHPLMPDPGYTLRRGTQPAEFGKWNVTVREFRRMLPQLRANGWVLVDLESIVRTVRTTKGPVVRRAPLMLPRGTKPLVISVDDLNYPQYMIANRLNSRLVLDAEGQVAAERVDGQGRRVVSRASEIVPILDRFVQRHPDFSINGAKGVIALTGWEGILGYRTSGDGRRARKEQVKVAPIVQRLKQTGWSFASHTYAHPDLAAVPMAQLQQDTDKWERYVEPLIGDNVRTLVYPYGSFVDPGSARFAYLRRAGFDVFCTIGPTASLTVGRGYAVQSRVHVDGLSLTTQKPMLRRFFDPDAVLDPVRPGV